jgi:hypothetical protein
MRNRALLGPLLGLEGSEAFACVHSCSDLFIASAKRIDFQFAAIFLGKAAVCSGVLHPRVFDPDRANQARGWLAGIKSQSYRPGGACAILLAGSPLEQEITKCGERESAIGERDHHESVILGRGPRHGSGRRLNGENLIDVVL